MKKLIRFISALLLPAIVSMALASCSDDNSELIEAAKKYYSDKLAAFSAENGDYSPFEVDAVFLGDSLTDGYDLKKYFPEYLVLNRGISGDTTVGLQARLKVSVYDVQPKAVVMLIGANNMDVMMENYEDILLGFKENLPKSRIILLSLTSMSGEWGKKNQLAAYNNVQIKMLAEKHGFDFVDLYSALLNLETGEIYAEYTTDGGHLTSRGYEVLTSKIKPALKGALASFGN